MRVPTLDVSFMLRWSPARWTAAGLIGYFLLVVVSPFEYDTSVITLDAALYAIAVLVAFFGGCWTVTMLGKSDEAPRPQAVSVSPDMLINITVALGTIGIISRIYDRFVLRSFVFVADSFAETRASGTETVSVFGYIGGLLFSFGIIALMLIWTSSSQRRRPLMFAYTIFLGVYPALEALLGGSRSIMMYVAFLVFFFARSTNAMPWLVRSPWALAGAGAVMAVFMEVIYEIRSLQTANDLTAIADVFQTTQISQYATPPQWLTEALINDEGTLIGGILKVWAHMVQYLTHSWIVYFINFENFQNVLGWGTLEFPLPVRVLSVVIQENLTYDPVLYGYENGVFPTAIIGVYYDFGVVGPLMAACFGALVTWIHREAIRCPERWLPLCAAVCLACVAIMVDNFLVAALGGFTICTFTAYALLHAMVSVLSRRGDAGEDGRNAVSGATST